MGDWINNLGFIHKMEYSAIFQKSKLHIHKRWKMRTIHGLLMRRCQSCNPAHAVTPPLWQLCPYVCKESAQKESPERTVTRSYPWDMSLEDRKQFSIQTCSNFLQTLFFFFFCIYLCLVEIQKSVSGYKSLPPMKGWCLSLPPCACPSRGISAIPAAEALCLSTLRSSLTIQPSPGCVSVWA